jgi:hypothetical protein
MSLQFTVNSLASFFVLLVPSQEHSPLWSLLAVWERVAVPQPTLCIRPSFATLSSPIDPLIVMLFRQFGYRAVAECIPWVMTSFTGLGLVFPQGQSRFQAPFWIFQALYYTYFLSCQEVTWYSGLFSLVPHCSFFFFLNIQQSWAGQSKLHGKNKATLAQPWCRMAKNMLFSCSVLSI